MRLTLTDTDILYRFNDHIGRSKHRRRIMEGLVRRGGYGATSQEIEEALSLGHGTVSGALSILHERGALELLEDKRSGQRVYVVPDFVFGRPIRPRTTFHCPGCRCDDE